MHNDNVYHDNMHNGSICDESTITTHIHHNGIHHNDIKALRDHIILASPNLGAAENTDKWWLLGTSGCHLCDIAEQIIMQFQAVQPITYKNVDIADFDEPLMMAFATTIPVILTPSKRLNYPFSVMDLQQLLT
ncbi:glutaredoxin family protein [Psychrobacter vallis]|uniref:glutaredoxin family protein n=1 Tax=Psychrobacter vallis TaxID=248451 RepID=UPI001D12B5B8|nr:glutaredoxin family protein [Psychrobacter vallis]